MKILGIIYLFSNFSLFFIEYMNMIFWVLLKYFIFLFFEVYKFSELFVIELDEECGIEGKY